MTYRITPVNGEPGINSNLSANPMRAIVFLLSLSFTFPGMAWEAEILVDGQPIPAEIIDGYQVHHKGVEFDCPPLSDIRERDKIVVAWVRVKAAQAQAMTLNEEDTVRIAELEEELTSERGENDLQYRNKHHWLILSNKSDDYWRSSIRKVTEQEIETEYDRLIENEDARFVNAPFFKRVQMESYDEQTLQQLANRLRAGETWRQVSQDVDPLDWNSHSKDLWHDFDSLDRYDSKAFYALNLDGRQLLRNDVIGPLAENGRYRLLVILDKTTVSVVPLNASLELSKKWAAREIQGDLQKQRYNALSASLLENVEVTQDGERVSIALEHDRCPG